MDLVPNNRPQTLHGTDLGFAAETGGVSIGFSLGSLA